MYMISVILIPVVNCSFMIIIDHVLLGGKLTTISNRPYLLSAISGNCSQWRKEYRDIYWVLLLRLLVRLTVQKMNETWIFPWAIKLTYKGTFTYQLTPFLTFFGPTYLVWHHADILHLTYLPMLTRQHYVYMFGSTFSCIQSAHSIES